MQKHKSPFNLLHQRSRELWHPLFDLSAMASIPHFHQTKLVFLRACIHPACKPLKSNCIRCKGYNNSGIRTLLYDKATLPALGIWLEVTCGHRSFHPRKPEGGDSVAPGTLVPCVRARTGTHTTPVCPTSYILSLCVHTNVCWWTTLFLSFDAFQVHFWENFTENSLMPC